MKIFNKINRLTLALISFLVLSAGIVLTQGATTPVYAADAVGDACSALNTATGSSGSCSRADANTATGKLVKTVINILSTIVGAVSVVMIIIGGFRYVVSSGDSNGLQGAKNTILYAIVGLIVVLFAQIIVRYVMKNVT